MNGGEDKERAAAAVTTETASIRKIRAGEMKAAVYTALFGPASLISLSRSASLSFVYGSPLALYGAIYFKHPLCPRLRHPHCPYSPWYV